jgi:hypothetical protein
MHCSIKETFNRVLENIVRKERDVKGSKAIGV